MIEVKDLDKDWYWYGYICGANSRKRVVESPNVIKNLGKQGIKITPSEQQKVSFYIGLMVGRHKIVQNFDVVKAVQYQDKGHKSKGDYLTLSIGKVDAERGQTVSLPIYISNNSADNRGFCGFQLKIKYNPTYLSFQSLTPSSLWTSSFEYLHDAKSGIVQVQGMREDLGYEDMVVGYISFKVLDTAPASQSVSFQGASGTEDGTNLLTLIGGEPYYIMPLDRENGLIEIKSETSGGDSSSKDKVYSEPIGSNNDVFGTNTDFTYDFTLGLGHIGGSGSGGGANIIFGITIGGVRYEVEIPLQEGEHRYTGKIPLRLPSITTGPVVIDYYVKPNDDSDLYYWFIKAGALWGFESTVPREEVNQIPIIETSKAVIERFILYDGFIISSNTPPTPPTPSIDYITIEEILSLVDGLDIDSIDIGTFGINILSKLVIRDGMVLNGVEISDKPEEKPTDKDFVLSDGVVLKLTTIPPKDIDEISDFSLTDGFILN